MPVFEGPYLKKNSIPHSVRNGLSAGQSLRTLTWPRGPGFLNRINHRDYIHECGFK
jgi:hypothetical protein